MTYEFSGDLRQTQRTLPSFRSPKRITITLPNNAYEHLIQRSDKEGRSLSNLAAYLLESALSTQEESLHRSI